MLFRCEQEADHSTCNSTIDSLNLVIEGLQDNVEEQKALVRLEATKAYKRSLKLDALKEKLRK